MDDFPKKTVRGVTLRADPPRESVFQVVQLDAEMHEYPGMAAQGQREKLHRHMSNEMGSLDIAAQCLSDFPQAPWELRVWLARQAWDESRHVLALYRKLRKLGGRKGEFPIANFEWSVTCSLNTLAARLAVQNRTFEAGQLDLLGSLPRNWCTRSLRPCSISSELCNSSISRTKPYRRGTERSMPWARRWRRLKARPSKSTSSAGAKRNSAKRRYAPRFARPAWVPFYRPPIRGRRMTDEPMGAEACFGEEPVRDSRFQVKQRWSECCNLPDEHPQKRTEFLHRQMNEELNSLEISARAVADFPDAPWVLRLRIARQCADEAR